MPILSLAPDVRSLKNFFVGGSWSNATYAHVGNTIGANGAKQAGNANHFLLGVIIPQHSLINVADFMALSVQNSADTFCYKIKAELAQNPIILNAFDADEYKIKRGLNTDGSVTDFGCVTAHAIVTSSLWNTSIWYHHDVKDIIQELVDLYPISQLTMYIDDHDDRSNPSDAGWAWTTQLDIDYTPALKVANIISCSRFVPAVCIAT